MKRHLGLLITLLLINALACGGSESPSQSIPAPEQGEQLIPGMSDEVELGNITSMRVMTFWRAEYADGSSEELILEEELTRTPLAYHSITEVNDRGLLKRLEVTHIDDQRWSGLEGNWTQAEGVPFSFATTQIPIFLLDYSERLDEHYQLLDPETINNIPTQHYRLTTSAPSMTSPWWISVMQTSFSLGKNLTEFVTEMEELWIADSAEFPAFAVRLVREAEAKDSEGNLVQISESRFILDINGSVVIQPPATSPTDWPPPDIPIYPGGIVETMTPETGGGLMIIFADADPEAVALFYEKNLPQQGWGQTETSKTTDAIVESWTKGGSVLRLEINAQGERSSVTITVAPQ